MEGTIRSAAPGTTAEALRVEWAGLSAGAVVLERRAAAIERFKSADRNLARAAAERLEAVNAFRVEAEAANTNPDAGPADARPAGASSAGASSADGAVGARARYSLPPDLERRSVRAEFAAAARISERAAETQLAMAEALMTELTETMDALRAGEIGERHARLIWEHSCHLPATDRPAFEEHALVAARKLSPARLVGRLRDIAGRLHPDTATVRHQAAVETRDVWIDPLPDGMAILSIRHTAAKLIPAINRIENYARGLTGDPDEPRTLPQCRADTAVEFLFNGDLGDVTIAPTAHVVVPALSLAGMSEELAILEGYGPIDLATARTLLADAPEFLRLVTHPATGTILAVDTYKPTTALRRWLAIRDQTCRAPGCGRAATYCELDHTLEWAADRGPTAFDNLAYLCVNHHRLKTTTGWSYQHLDRHGTLEWTTPLGETYITEPPVRILGSPHLDDAIRQALRESDSPPPETFDHIPDDLYARLQTEMDDEIRADLARDPGGALNGGKFAPRE